MSKSTNHLGHEFRFPFEIAQSMEIGDVKIVRLQDDSMTKSDFERCIYGLGADGKVLWQIERLEPVEEIKPALWNFITLDERGELCATNLMSVRCWIDPQTGRILKQEWERGI